MSLYDKDNLVTTQNIRLGTLRLRERLSDVAKRTVRYAAVIEELLNNEMRTYRKLYLKDRNIRNMLLVGNYIQYINKYIHKDRDVDQITKEEFITFYDEFIQSGQNAMAVRLGISNGNSSLLLPTLVIYKRLLEHSAAVTVVILCVSLGSRLAFA